MSKWYVVVRKDTGEAVSYGSVVADTEELSRRELEAIELGEAMPDLMTHRWDPATRKHIKRVRVDRAEQASVDARLGGLTPIQRTAVRDVLAEALGADRYRDE